MIGYFLGFRSEVSGSAEQNRDFDKREERDARKIWVEQQTAHYGALPG